MFPLWRLLSGWKNLHSYSSIHVLFEEKRRRRGGGKILLQGFRLCWHRQIKGLSEMLIEIFVMIGWGWKEGGRAQEKGRVGRGRVVDDEEEKWRWWWWMGGTQQYRMVMMRMKMKRREGEKKRKRKKKCCWQWWGRVTVVVDGGDTATESDVWPTRERERETLASLPV